MLIVVPPVQNACFEVYTHRHADTVCSDCCYYEQDVQTDIRLRKWVKLARPSHEFWRCSSRTHTDCICPNQSSRVDTTGQDCSTGWLRRVKEGRNRPYTSFTENMVARWWPEGQMEAANFVHV